MALSPATYAVIVAKWGSHYQILPTSFTKETIVGQGMKMEKPGQIRQILDINHMSIFRSGLKCARWQLWGVGDTGEVVP